MDYVAMRSLARPAALKTLSIAPSSFGNGTLFTPLPISWIAEERKAAPGSEISSSRLAPPTCTKRTGFASSADFEIVTITVFVLSPHRYSYPSPRIGRNPASTLRPQHKPPPLFRQTRSGTPCLHRKSKTGRLEVQAFASVRFALAP